MTVDYTSFNFVRAAAYAPVLSLADPLANATRVAIHVADAAKQHAHVALFPELSLTGYSVEDLFFAQRLQEQTRHAIAHVAAATLDHGVAAVFGAPFALTDGRLLNCAFICAEGRVIGAVPKMFLPNYGEFYDQRWFTSGASVHCDVDDKLLGRFAIGIRQLFTLSSDHGECRLAVEVCEDLWAVQPPGSEHALAGADLILNPSASNELVGKADYRRDLVRMASAQRLCGYLYAGSGPSESSKDVVFGGHLLAAECGSTLGESERFALDGAQLCVDFDLGRIRHDRLHNKSFGQSERPFRYAQVPSGKIRPLENLLRDYPRQPFVPDDEHQLDARAQEILAIQSTGLARRLRSIGDAGMVIGLSGGLDSTLAFLVALDALDKLAMPHSKLLAVTMPGPATSQHTLETARALAAAAAAPIREININAAVSQHLSDLGHDGHTHDVTFENAQARERTQLLFNLANLQRAIVVGTGDLSELALGWCTFNGDHMANYNVNAGVPKTLVSYLVRWYAQHRAAPELAQVLRRVLDTPISPELVPRSNAGGDADIAQHTEQIIGPYVLHDFFLYYFLRHGFAPGKILQLATRTFAGEYSHAEVERWLREFLTRFFRNQFKRTTLPPGPKVGSVSLSPRGDWRMPDEAAVNAFLDDLPPRG